MHAQVLYKIVEQLLTPKKTILASDESPSSANKALEKLGVKGTTENRRIYRELFIDTPGIGKYLNGIILSDETFRQSNTNRILFRDILKKENILVGVKVDRSTLPIPNFPDETYTQGIDGLEERVAEYKALGAKFAKWRSTYKVTESSPSEQALELNSLGLTQYAGICQAGGLVPFVEPEVLYNGNHTIEQASLTNSLVLKHLFTTLERYKVDNKGLILKTSMVLAGKDNKNQSTPEEVAKATVEVLKAAVPKEVGGIVFLSGGQSAEQATENFNEIAKHKDLTWPITSSFLRAQEGPAALIWNGKKANVEEARKVFIETLKKNALAELGKL